MEPVWSIHTAVNGIWTSICEFKPDSPQIATRLAIHLGKHDKRGNYCLYLHDTYDDFEDGKPIRVHVGDICEGHMLASRIRMALIREGHKVKA